MTEEFALCWNNFTDNIINGFSSLLVGDSLCDVTLAVEGKLLKAHKIVLSLSSPYFKAMFSANPCQHPIIVLKDIRSKMVENLLEFIYLGKTNVRQMELKSFMEVAESLQVKGLSTSQKEAKEAIESLMENAGKENHNGGGTIKRSHSQSELSEEPHGKEPKLEDVTDLTEDDCDDNFLNDTDSMPMPEISMEEPRFEEPKKEIKEMNSGLKITSIISTNPMDFVNDKYGKAHDIPQGTTSPSNDVVMYSTTSLLYDECIYNRNNIVATQQGLKTYWLCKSYRVNMCKARCITYQGKVISATGQHNHPPHTNSKLESLPAYNHMSNPPSEFFNHSVPTTSSHPQPPMIQSYQHYSQLMNPNQIHFSAAQNHPRSPNVLHPNTPPLGSFKMENH